MSFISVKDTIPNTKTMPPKKNVPAAAPAPVPAPVPAAPAAASPVVKSPKRAAATAPVVEAVPPPQPAVAAAPAPAAKVPRAKKPAAAAPAAAPAPEPVAAAEKPKRTRAKKAEEVVTPAQVLINSKPATTPSGEVVTLKRNRRTKKVADPAKPPRNSPYNDFMKVEIARIKAVTPGIAHKDAFSQAANNWKASKVAKA